MKKAISIILVFLVVFFVTTGYVKQAMRAEVDEIIKSADWALKTETAVILNYESGALKIFYLKEPIVEMMEILVFGVAILGIAIWGSTSFKKAQ